MAAALVVDGVVVAACEEERFTRIKHAEEARVDNPHELPVNAIRLLRLDHAGLRPDEIDCIAYSFDPELRRTKFRAEWWPDPSLEAEFLRRLGEVGDVTSTLMGRPLGRSLKFVPHHLAHAASAYYPSGFDAAAILVIDGIGEADCSMLGRATGSESAHLNVSPIPIRRLPVGAIEHLSRLLALRCVQGHGASGLRGDPEVFREQFASIVAVSEDSYSVDLEAIDFKSIEMQRLQALLGPMRDMDEEIVPHHKHVAAALQAATDAAVIALVRRLERSVGGRRLCLSGGVALNCVTNSLISRMTGYSEISIPQLRMTQERP